MDIGSIIDNCKDMASDIFVKEKEFLKEMILGDSIGKTTYSAKKNVIFDAIPNNCEHLCSTIFENMENIFSIKKRVNYQNKARTHCKSIDINSQKNNLVELEKIYDILCDISYSDVVFRNMKQYSNYDQLGDYYKVTSSLYPIFKLKDTLISSTTTKNNISAKSPIKYRKYGKINIKSPLKFNNFVNKAKKHANTYQNILSTRKFCYFNNKDVFLQILQIIFSMGGNNDFVTSDYKRKLIETYELSNIDMKKLLYLHEYIGANNGDIIMRDLLPSIKSKKNIPIVPLNKNNSVIITNKKKTIHASKAKILKRSVMKSKRNAKTSVPQKKISVSNPNRVSKITKIYNKDIKATSKMSSNNNIKNNMKQTNLFGWIK